MASELLSRISDLRQTLFQPIHPTLYPFPLVSTLHALRVLLAYRSILRARGSRLPLLRDLAGYLVMCWGGSFLSHYLLLQIPPQLLSIRPWIQYLSVYFLINLIPIHWIHTAWLDLSFPLLDGATRTAAALSGLDLVIHHSNPLVRQSLVAQLLIPTLSASAGGISAFTLNVFNQDGWKFSTPSPLTYSKLYEFTDLLAPFLAILVYHFVNPLSTFSFSLSSSSSSSSFGSWFWQKESTALSSDHAKALVVIIIAACFFIKAVYVHLFLSSSSPPPSTPSTPSRSKQKKNL